MTLNEGIKQFRKKHIKPIMKPKKRKCEWGTPVDKVLLSEKYGLVFVVGGKHFGLVHYRDATGAMSSLSVEEIKLMEAK